MAQIIQLEIRKWYVKFFRQVSYKQRYFVLLLCISLYFAYNRKDILACALGHTACRKFRAVKYIRMSELLDELNVAKGCDTLKKTIKSYQKVELFILDKWLIRALPPGIL